MSHPDQTPAHELPAWLRRRPQYHLAAWLLWRAGPWRWLLLPTAAAAAGVLALLPAHYGVAATAAAHPAAVFGASLILFLARSIRRRQSLALARAHSWVGALPTAASLPEHVCVAPLTVCATITVIAALDGWMEGMGSRMFAACAAFLCGSCAGMLLALLAPQRLLGRPRDRRVGPSRSVAHTRPSVRPLGHWAVALKQAWSRPKVLARGSFVILMGIPMTESSAGFTRTALAAVAGWFVAHHLVSLLLALLRTAFPAARWLSATPLSACRFTLCLSHRVWIKEAVACFLLVCVAPAAHAQVSTGTTSLLAVNWLTACVLLGVVACVIARYSGMLRSFLHRRSR
jgi:hypothetical protein